MSKTYSAGIVTAYGAAKRAGYQGTYEDFCRQQAEYAENAQAVETAKNTAVSAANTATTKAGEAATAATAAQTAKIQTEAAASQALTDISTARSGAISAVQTEGQTQTANARAQAQAAEASATTASTKASEASASATTAITKATEAAASATSAAQSASDAQDVLDSIPADYSDLNANVSQLSDDLVHVTDGYFPIELVAIANKYIDQNDGKLLEYNGWVATDYISCDGVNTLYITTTKNSIYGAFYSSKDESTRIARLSVTLGTNVVEVPTNAKYFRLSNTTADMLSTKISLMMMSQLIDVQNTLPVINQGEKDIGAYVPYEYIDSKSGSFVSDSSYKRTGYIPITDYLDGVIYFTSNCKTPFCYFYTADYTPIEAFVIFVGETFVKIPANAVYCAFSYSRFNARVTMYDATYSAFKALHISDIRDINLKYLERTDILTQLINKPLLLVYTDIHGYPSNFDRIEKFYDNNLKNYVAFPICLGDMVRDQATDDITFMDTDFGKATLKVIGNHDVLVRTTLPGITASEAYNRYIAPNVDAWGVVQPTGAAANGYTYYYKDVIKSDGTLRVIVLDEYYYDQTQHDWFVSTLADANTHGYSVVVCQHQSNIYNDQATPLNDKWAFATPKLGFDLYRRDSGYAGNYNNAAENRAMAVDTFIGNGGEFICWMSGHTHSDQSHTFEKTHGKQLSLVFSNASMGMTSSIRVANYACDCFQYVAVDLAEKYIYVLRIGIAVDKWFHKNTFLCYDYANHIVKEYH